MNRARLKNYAPQARREFIQAMTDRAAFYGLTATKIEPVMERGDVAVILGRELPLVVSKKRQKLAERIKLEGFDHTIEALAYTWFNRLVAIRYMELRGYLDHGYRVLSHPEGKPTPEILQHAEHVDLPGLNREIVIDLKLAGNKDAELYRMLLVAQCNALNRGMPFLFERIDDETELLLPDNLLHSDSLIRTLISNLEAEDCESVEVLGWLYQFYISERKDQVMARKSAVPTEDIPAVTQLFTPHWIVRYLVENSLGRLWLLNHPDSRLREHMPYYIEGDAETDFLKITKPEEIRVCDPAVGSGHMLTYAFDLLTLIYEEKGYAPGQIPALILKHNLSGFEICPRAAQLAGLALVFKGRERSHRFLQSEHLVQPHIVELRDVAFDDNELRDYIGALGLGELFTQPVLALFSQFEEAKNFGSLIQPCLDEQTITFVHRAIEAKDLGGRLFLRDTHLKVLRVLEQAEALTRRYHVVVANPPYMGSGNMNPSLKGFAAQNYEQSKSDLFSMFTWRSFSLGVPRSYSSFVTMHSWMFLSGFEKFRKSLLTQKSFVTMAHLGPRGFDAIGGEVVQTTAFVCWNSPNRKDAVGFLRLTTGNSESEKDALLREAAANKSSPITFRVGREHFLRIPGEPLAYWVSDAMSTAFTRFESIATLGETRIGLITGENSRYIRNWHEVAWPRVGLNLSRQEAASSNKRWFPQSKGGGYRKWYGNNETVVDWSGDGAELQTRMHSSGERVLAHNFNLDRIFQPAITWTKISGGDFAARLQPHGFLFNDASANLFIDSAEARLAVLAFLSSCLPICFLEALNPTLNFLPGNVSTLPLVQPSPTGASALASEAVSLARSDWDNFETSWDFLDQPLLRPELKGETLEASWRNWQVQSTAAIRRMQELETENNRLFIAAYGLDDELRPEVSEAQITIARADAHRDVAAFLSYAVGCMMGRYSLDRPGLILADAADTVREFLAKVGLPQEQLTFTPDEDGIIPVLGAEWFEDDIVARAQEFLRATFGEATLQENLRFIEDSLGKDLRKYFLADFYRDHLQTYRKRPIYWLFSSGKQRAFQCLVYIHRYHEGTLARMRTEYVIPLQGLLASRIEQLEADKAKATSTSHRKKLQKEQDDLKKQQPELLTFEEKLKHAADQKISLDLDDGVKVNYGKFGDLLAESKGIAGGTDDE